MAVTRIVVAVPTDLAANANKEHRMTGLTNVPEALESASGEINYIIFDNTTPGAITYLKLWDQVATPDHDVDASDHQIAIPAGTKRTIHYTDGIAFANGLHAATSTGKGLTEASVTGCNVTIGVTLD